MKLIAFLGLIGIVIGCGGPTSSQKDKPEVKPLIKNPVTVVTAPGAADARDPKTKARAYHIEWKRATIDFGNEGVFAGSMTTVSGVMYEDNKEASVFRADSAEAVRETQMLTLLGNVRVESKGQKAVLSCDKAEWHAAKRLIKAFGHVRIAGPAGTLSGLSEVWAKPDLKIIGTPDTFGNL